MHIEVFPEIEVDAKYKKIKLPKTHFEVKDEEVNQTLTEIQKKFTRFETTSNEYETKMGDKVYITTQ
jgi:FKBP-type peptidyl-prolyl cis-trans isomerase (trigger factor)